MSSIPYGVFIFCFCVPFATLCSCEPATAEPNTSFVLLLLLLVPPPALLCLLLPLMLVCLLLRQLVTFFYFCSTTLLWRTSATRKVYFLSPQVAGTSGWIGNLYEKLPNRQIFWSIFLDGGYKWIEARLALPNALHPRAGHGCHLLLWTQGKSSLRGKSKKNAKKTNCYSALTRGIYKKYSNIVSTWQRCLSRIKIHDCASAEDFQVEPRPLV